MATPIKNSEEGWKILQGPKGSLAILADRAALDFAARLLETFGQRYAEAIKKQLNKPLKELLDHVHRVLFEIQKKLEKGETVYSDSTFSVGKNSSISVS